MNVLLGIGMNLMGSALEQQAQLSNNQAQANALQQAAYGASQAQGLMNAASLSARNGYGLGQPSALPLQPRRNYAAEVQEPQWEREYREKIEAQDKLTAEARRKAENMIADLAAHPFDTSTETPKTQANSTP